VKLVRSKGVREKVIAMRLEYKIKRIGKEGKESLIKDDTSRAKIRKSVRKK
jgi:predicted GIY-YIG superfamily endonuclease